VLQDIINWYKKGTDFHIRMDEDGLIEAGAGYDQVTWMDVRFGDILPTPRHGKPVEINAYWYNALRIVQEFSRLQGENGEYYAELAEQVRESFQQKFWNEEKGCLKDVLSGEKADDQIRCNQIWAVSLPFTMLSVDKARKIVDKVFERLYTPYGLRSLDKYDPAFKASYGGSHFERDMAYHQGTVWAFPLGAYYLAYLKVQGYSASAKLKVLDQLAAIEACMREGCVGQIAEIYDGAVPTISQGCYAQAWSVSEMLRVFAVLEKEER
jgi:predicted glycogen debranching enzyme